MYHSQKIAKDFPLIHKLTGLGLPAELQGETP